MTRLSADDVAAYEARQSFDPSAELALLRDLGLTASDRLVEFGSGPGAFAVAAAGLAGEVIAVDPSPAMCEHLSRRAADASLDNVTVVNAGFLTYAHEGRPVRFVFSKNAMHHLPDFWKAQALCRVHDILEPGGILRLRDLVFSFSPDQADEMINEWLDSANDQPSGWSREVLADHVRSEFSTYTWLLEPMLARVGFDIIDQYHSDSGIFAHYTCSRR